MGDMLKLYSLLIYSEGRDFVIKDKKRFRIEPEFIKFMNYFFSLYKDYTPECEHCANRWSFFEG